jgi:hypothetical protein
MWWLCLIACFQTSFEEHDPAAWRCMELVGTLEANQRSSVFPCFFSGDAGEFRASLWQSVSSTPALIFGIERSKDSDGNKTADNFAALSCNASSSTIGVNQQTVLPASLVGNQGNGTLAAALTVGSGTSTVATHTFTARVDFGGCLHPVWRSWRLLRSRASRLHRLKGGTIGSTWSETITAQDGISANAFAVISGALSAGFTLASFTGMISCAPTAAGAVSFSHSG